MPADFVYEHPEVAQARKRRARVVLSCDRCREKKVKCVKLPDQANCNGCIEAHEVCTFHDQGRYHAERGRLYATQIAPDSLMSAALHPGGEAFVPDAFGSVYATPLGTQGASMAVLSFAPSSGTSSRRTSPPRPSSPDALDALRPTPRTGPALSSSLDPPLRTDLHATSLCPTQPDQPNPLIMPSFIEAFFALYGKAFPFMHYECVVGAFLSSTLNVCMANCIASLAVPYAVIPELGDISLQDASQTYATKAEELAPDEDSTNVRSIILLARIGLRDGRREAFMRYTEHAARVAQRLRIMDEESIAVIAANDREHNQLLAMRNHILDLQQRVSLMT